MANNMKGLIKQILSENIFISPFKGKNVLFHSIKFIDGIISILNNDVLWPATNQTIKTKLSSKNKNYNTNSKNYKGVSLTRDVNLYFGDIQLILDGDLIKQDYGKNLIPHDFYNNTDTKFQGSKKSDPSRGYKYESEEFLIGELKPLSKYLLGIRITRDENLQEFKNDDPEGYEMIIDSIGNIPLFNEDFKSFKEKTNMKNFIRKSIREQMIDGQNMNQGTQTVCNTMSVATYAEGIKLIVAAIGRPEENPEIWKRIAKPINNWKNANTQIGDEVKSGGMSGDSMVDESNTYWTMVQNVICEQGPDFE